ncbi:hypothetical protein [Loigolactobacillus bifermentans]|jgi:hypothetical protein|uniref:Uncharacterized protein n=1 Tax=Loigolactobacillus bifermentans DSM 20003 TaxID=1423726 RepID=A0A0R1GGQ2_9LACO|nr:hypothetical protein [Loigolactobacillus bifermentans]KRK33208.1 hypothetical protein FC07_GL001463 [Loigolactobacillus bifermentans DSM 20003]QGG60554.1 hypothetical protein LB003_08810 [Loigolactobacillus bifermentans]
MLNFKQPELRDVIAAPANIGKLRQTLRQLYQRQRQYSLDQQQWLENEAAFNELEASYTRILADKIWEAFEAETTIEKTDLFQHIWISVTAVNEISINYASTDGQTNRVLLTINDALTKTAYLQAKHLPTLNQDLTDYFLGAEALTPLITMIKLLYKAGLTFQTPQETILQPVDDLSFLVTFPEPKTFTKEILVSDNVHEPARFDLELAPYALQHFEVTDDEDNDITDLGHVTVTPAGELTWRASAKDLPDLLNHQLTLTATAVNIDALPCLEDLFVTASNEGILMRTGDKLGQYQLVLTEDQQLGLQVNANDLTLTLSYPDSETHIYELDRTYPFLIKWLEQTIK